MLPQWGVICWGSCSCCASQTGVLWSLQIGFPHHRKQLSALSTPPPFALLNGLRLAHFSTRCLHRKQHLFGLLCKDVFDWPLGSVDGSSCRQDSSIVGAFVRAWDHVCSCHNAMNSWFCEVPKRLGSAGRTRDNRSLSCVLGAAWQQRILSWPDVVVSDGIFPVCLICREMFLGILAHVSELSQALCLECVWRHLVSFLKIKVALVDSSKLSCPECLSSCSCTLEPQISGVQMMSEYCWPAKIQLQAL